MVDAVPPNWTTPGAGSLLGRLRARGRRHPDEFQCAVRVVSGDVDGESARWSYRRSAVDPLRTGRSIRLTHGDVRLELTITGEPVPARGLRAGHLAWPAVESGSGAQLEIGAHPDHESDLLQP